MSSVHRGADGVGGTRGRVQVRAGRVRWDRAAAVAIKDFREIGPSPQFWLPTTVVPLIFFMILPLVVTLAVGASQSALGNVSTFLTRMMSALPEAAIRELDTMAPGAAMAYLFLVYLFAPMFLIAPLMVANIIGTSSFVGEKERRTMESLLYTPLTDRELIAGKMLAALVPALAVTLIGFVVYAATVNVAGWHLFGRVVLPNATWIALVLWLSPAASFLGLGVAVVVSLRAAGFQEAQQVAGIIVVPVLALVFGQAAGVIFLSVQVILALGAVIFLAGYLLLRWGARRFSRAEIVTRL